MYNERVIIPTRRRNGKTTRTIIFTTVPLLVGICYIALGKATIQRHAEAVQKFAATNLNLNYFSKNDVEDDGRNGRYPNSLITLFYPYTMLSDVVLGQPVPLTDIPFFWHIHNSDERILKGILTSCLGLELVELNDLESIQRARETDLVSTLDRYRHVITSPFIREVSEIFTTDHFARMFCFFRHPLDYDLNPVLPRFEREDNWLTRFLSNWHRDDITFKELGVAKHVVRECCVVGTIDKMRGSVIRMKDYFGWEYARGMGDFAGEKCIDDALAENPIETYIDHESEEWDRHYEMNRFDCEVYEISQSAWRAQIQTMVPYTTQLSRKVMLDEADAKKAAKKKAKADAEKAKIPKKKKFGIF